MDKTFVIEYSFEKRKNKMGDIIQAERKKKNLTQDDLAALVGASKATISNYENGKNTQKSEIDILVRIAIALDLSLDELLGLDKAKESNNKSDEYYFDAIKTFVDISDCDLVFDTYVNAEHIYLEIHKPQLAYYIQEYKKRAKYIDFVSDQELQSVVINALISDFDKKVSDDYTIIANKFLSDKKPASYKYEIDYQGQSINRIYIGDCDDLNNPEDIDKIPF